jgi:hypothetical protein
MLVGKPRRVGQYSSSDVLSAPVAQRRTRIADVTDATSPRAPCAQASTMKT